MSQEITVKSTRATICATETSELLEIPELASRTLERCVYACYTKFVAWLALFFPIFIVAFRATFHNNASLNSFDKLERAIAFNAVIVSGSIAVTALSITPVALLDTRCLIEPAEEPFRTHAKVDFSHFNHF